jgi:hypothetical protein
MASEFDLSTDLATIQARLNGAFNGIHEILETSPCNVSAAELEQQLKEQTRQMKEMASMMKSMMGMAMPLLEEKANKLRKEKEAEAEEARKQAEEIRKKEERARKQEKEKLQRQQLKWHRDGATCTRPYCNYRIIPGRTGMSSDEVCCAQGHYHSILAQRPANHIEKSYIESFLHIHEYEIERQRIGDKARWDTTRYTWVWEDTHFVRSNRLARAKEVAPAKKSHEIECKQQ